MALRTSTKIANRARRFRKGLTEPEIMLWSRLKGRGKDRPIFRRQVPVGSIILDFYCPAAKLAVEVDGRTHWDDDAQAKDQARDYWLAQRGVVVMRIGAGAVYRNVGEVADGVIRRADDLIARALAPKFEDLPFPRSGRGGPPAEERVVEREGRLHDIASRIAGPRGGRTIHRA